MTDGENGAPGAATAGAGGETNLTPEEAAKLVMGGAATLQRNWLQAAVTVARAVSQGQPVSPGSFEDLRRLREHCEELDRAAGAVSRISKAAQKAQQGGGQDPAN